MGTNGIARRTYSARMRDLNDDVTTLEVNTGESGEAQVEVPGFGVLLVAKVISPDPLNPISQWKAVLIQPDDEGMLSPKSNHIRLKAKVVLAHVEIDIPNKKDRLTVILVP